MEEAEEEDVHQFDGERRRQWDGGGGGGVRRLALWYTESVSV